MDRSTSNESSSSRHSMNKLTWVGLWAIALSTMPVAAADSEEAFKPLKLLEIKGKVTDRAQNRGYIVCRVKPLEGEEKDILIGNMPYETRKAFDLYQANQNPAPALQRLEGELADRRAEYVAALNSGAPDRVDAATKALEATKEQLTRMRDLSAPEK